MRSGLTATMNFGLSSKAMKQALQLIGSGQLRSLGRDEGTAQTLGIGTVQVEALGAWMRLGGLVIRSQIGLSLSPFGAVVLRYDASVASDATWWVIHSHLSTDYSAWYALTRLPYQYCSVADFEASLSALAPEASARTVKNARTSVFRTLEDTPIGQQLGLFRLDGDSKSVTGLTKLPVRQGQAPMAAVAYVVLDWARREQLSSVGLTSLAAADGPGPILHMSEGALERYLIEIDGAYRGKVLSYSRTANLNEAYLRDDVTPLQVLTTHYLHEQEGLDWAEALRRAAEEVPATDDE